MVEVFAMICAVLLQNQAQDSVVLYPALSVAPSSLLAMAALRYDGLTTVLRLGRPIRNTDVCTKMLVATVISN